MKVLVAGGSGAIGQPLVRLLRAAGHDVAAVHRSPGSRAVLQALGATPIEVDVLDRTALLDALVDHRYDAVIAQLTSLKKVPTMHRHLAGTNRLRTEGTANLLTVAERVGARRFLTQSMVPGYGYGDFEGRCLTEADPFGPPGHGRFEEHLAAMRSNERQVLGATQVEGVALRYGFFYGPGPAGDVLVEGLRRRRIPVPRHGDVQPWIHVEDAAAATVLALERGQAGAAYNIADEEPASFADLLTAMAEALGAPRPLRVPGWLLAPMPYAAALMAGGLRVSSALARTELGWTPQFPSYRTGVLQVADHYRDGRRDA